MGFAPPDLTPTDITPATPIRLSVARARRLAAAIPLLVEALGDAEDAERDRWEFALTARELLSAGLTGTDLRWLVSRGLTEHAVERIPARRGRRSFRPAPDLAVTDASSYALTEAGRRMAAERLTSWGAATPPSLPDDADLERPHWDPDSRELTWRGRLVKRFRTPARSQELILAVFEEEEWATRIDDPLGQVPGRDSRQRLHDAVRRLNCRQHEARIRFSRDGTGMGICWLGGDHAPAPPPCHSLAAWHDGKPG